MAESLLGAEVACCYLYSAERYEAAVLQAEHLGKHCDKAHSKKKKEYFQKKKNVIDES